MDFETMIPPSEMIVCDFALSHGCTYVTKKQSTMSMHKAMKHGLIKPNLCSTCNLSFAVRTQLLHHITNKHKSPSVECPATNCKYVAKSSTSVKNHYVRNHMKTDTLFKQFDALNSECLTCEKHCKTSAIFYHVAVCSTESPFYKNKEDVVQQIKKPVQPRVPRRVVETGRDLELEVDNDNLHAAWQLQQLKNHEGAYNYNDDDDNQSLMMLAEISEDEILALANCEHNRRRKELPINVFDEYDDDMMSVDNAMFESLLS